MAYLAYLGYPNKDLAIVGVGPKLIPYSYKGQIGRKIDKIPATTS